jgi:pyruvate-formate lyase-activating enzyme
MSGIAEFLSGVNIKKCELMPYHRLGEGKYKSLGIDDVNIFAPPDDKLTDEIKGVFKAKGVNIE